MVSFLRKIKALRHQLFPSCRFMNLLTTQIKGEGSLEHTISSISAFSFNISKILIIALNKRFMDTMVFYTGDIFERTRIK